MKLYAILFLWGFFYRINYIAVVAESPPSVVPADRICKPGPPLKRISGKINCLIIGDSVSIGYTPWISRMLGKDYLVQHAPWDLADGGALDCKYGLQCLHLFLLTAMLEPTTYDVIIFNFGLHDINLDGQWPEEYTKPTDYAKNLEEIKSILLSTGAKVGYVLTTPVPYDETQNNLVIQYNTIATNVMKQHPSVATTDLYTWVVETCGDPPYQHCKIAAEQPNVHYTPQGYQYLAQKLQNLILDLLGNASETSLANYSFLQTEHKKRNIADWMTENRDSVPCRGKSGQVVTVCPNNATCCASRFSSSGQGCCVLPQASACSDGKHCCRAGYGCDPSCSIYQCSCLRV
ncbi:uncharacterized protein [Montipora capricornis]|uniref:uncharacterized protein isoform X2 n=1 Tax=Montipora capricornis TaxID=246305 RepID=UPI0035F12E73